MALEQLAEPLRLVALERDEGDEVVVHEALVGVEQERLAAGHPGAEVPAVRPEDDDRARASCTRSAWSPTPSTTATAPEFRTAKRSPAEPAQKSSPPVAP